MRYKSAINKKRILYLSAALFLLALAAGCGNTETRIAADLQSGMTYDTDAHTEEVNLPPAETDCLAVANEITLIFKRFIRIICRLRKASYHLG